MRILFCLFVGIALVSFIPSRAEEATELEQNYRSALVNAKRVVLLFEKNAATSQQAEKAINAVLTLKANDAAAMALLEKLGQMQKFLSLDLPGGVTIDLVLIPAGTFLMGSPENERDRDRSREKQHSVTISKPFYMGKFTVTQEQYEAVMGRNPSKFKGPMNPVEQVSWNEAVEFCDKLNDIEKAKMPAGMKTQLPTDAQWEYACRAGTQTRFYYGNDDGDFDGVAWYTENSDSKTHPVGEKKPNAWGLYDMYGNVWQWCQDSFTSEYEKLTSIDPFNAQGVFRLVRGGSWILKPKDCRSARRYSGDPDRRICDLGFRLVVAPCGKPVKPPKPPGEEF